MPFQSNVPATEVPAPVAEFARQVAEFTDSPEGDVFVADHTHEEVSEGSWTIALEGAYEWPHYLTEAYYKGEFTAPEGWTFEPYTGWCMIGYPSKH